MITSVKLVGICVKDQQRALDFYTQKLGFQVFTDVPFGPNSRWIEVRPLGAETHLALWTPPGLENRIGTFSQIVFRTDDIQATYRDLVQKGIKFIEPPREQGGGVMGQFLDAEGNIFVLRDGGE